MCIYLAPSSVPLKEMSLNKKLIYIYIYQYNLCIYLAPSSVPSGKGKEKGTDTEISLLTSA